MMQDSGARIDHQYGGVGGAGRTRHLGCVLLVSGWVGDDKQASTDRETAMGYIDRYGQVAFGVLRTTIREGEGLLGKQAAH
jgi:hypothetical protein